MKQQKPDNSPIVQQRDKLKGILEIKEFPWTPKQKEIIDLILSKETKLIFIEGPAGSSKTLLAVYCGLLLLSQKRVSEIMYVRTAVESAEKSLGYLPGELDSKFSVYGQPLMDKMEELLEKNDIKNLLKEKRVNAMPVNFLRGLNWNAKFITGDEAQNYSYKEIVTTITRIGKYTKMVLCGDSMQSDINGKSGGFQKIMTMFDNEESRKQGIFCVKLGKEDIMRSGLVKYIVETIENHRVEPMFPPKAG